MSTKRPVCSRWKFDHNGFTGREQDLLPPRECQPGGGSEAALRSAWCFRMQLHALCLEGKIRKTIHRLLCFDSEMLSLTCFLPKGAQGSWHLTCVESSQQWHFQSSRAAGSLYRVSEMWKMQLPAGQGSLGKNPHLFCITIMALSVSQGQCGKDCASFSKEKKWIIFRKCDPWEGLVYGVGCQKCGVFFVILPFLELRHHLYTLLNQTNYSKYIQTYTKVAKREQLWYYLAWLQHLWKRHLLCVTQFVQN